MTDTGDRKKIPLERRAVIEIWRLAQLIVAFATLYSLIIHIVNKVALWVTGIPADMTVSDALSAAPVATQLIGVKIPLPDPLAEFIIVCIVLGVLTYVVLKWVCEREWVKETVAVEECWEEVKWYNPFSWFVAIVCTIVEVVTWVLKLICGWVGVLVLVLVFLCIIIGVIVVFA